MSKLGIYGGTFNPVHLGHVHLLRQVKELAGLDRILIMPDRVPPHKEAPDLASSEDRLAMVKLAFDGIDGIEVSELELKREGRSYTYLTIRDLKALYPDAELFLIMGADMLLTFDKWVNYEEILRNATLIAAAREDGEYAALLEKAKALGNARILPTRPLPMSSTDVRLAAKAGSDLSGMVPESVGRYIAEHDLYRKGD